MVKESSRESIKKSLFLKRNQALDTLISLDDLHDQIVDNSVDTCIGYLTC